MATFNHACQVLEFRALLDVIAAAAASAAGRDWVAALQPFESENQVGARRALVAAVMGLRTAGTPAPQPGFRPIDDLLRSVLPEGAILVGEELLQCREFLDAAGAVAEFARRRAPATGALGELLAGIDPLPSLGQRLHRALDGQGQLLDNASPALQELRRQIHALEGKIQRQIEGILRRVEQAGVLQENFTTLRNNRYVIPVRREGRGRVPGVVHDHSDSGHTLFVEPAETLPLGNELADLRLEERDECRRILAQLSTLVREQAEDLRRDQEILAELDGLGAIASWAAGAGCVLPRFGQRLEMRGAAHPLLLHQFSRDGREHELVRLDVVLPAQTRVLLITGPNSGGKTAALKAVGLLALAAQAGLPVPVLPDSEFIFFRQVFADIGDEQSLAANLSTFTAHLAQARFILGEVRNGRSLVLFDEIGAGTDPLEGGALACAVLEELAAAGGLTIASTHLSAIKSFVHEREGMVSAAVRFNLDTLMPEYALEIGRPGASHALTIAARVGLPERVLEAARQLLSSDCLRLENMLAHIEEAQREVALREREIQETVRGLAGERDQVRDELRQLRDERRRLMHEAYEQASGLVENTRREMDGLLTTARRAGDASEQRERMKSARNDAAARERKLREAAAETQPKPARPLRVERLVVGEEVWVEKLRTNARVVAVSGDRKTVTVAAGALRFAVAAREIGWRDREAAESARPERLAESRPLASEQVAVELVLIGKTIDEALPVLDHYLDRAALARLPELRIVHGFGTGRLQQAVHAFLKKHALVARFRLGQGGADPGGGGVTLVELKRS